MPINLKNLSLPRNPGVSNRLVAVLLSARFMDELLSGLPTVLMPTIRSQFGLSYTQISLLALTLSYTAAFIEPVSGLLVDIWKRPWLMTWGAAGIGMGTMVIGAAPTFAILILGFVIYGMASGPLAHTADVVLVEAYANAPDRIYSRSTLIDTLGALLAPLLVSFAVWSNLEWRWLMIVLGSSSLIYAILIIRTRFPKPNDSNKVIAGNWKQSISINLKSVISNQLAITWLIFLFVHMVLETPLHFTTVWLREQAGMSQALIGVYRMLEMAVAILSLLILDRWLKKSGYRKILLMATVGLAILYPIWLLTPGIWQRFALSVPISFLFTVYWPIGKGQGLASSPGKGGTFTSIHSIFYLVPLPLLFGLLAESITLTRSMLIVTLAGLATMAVIILRMPSSKGSDIT